MLGSGLFNLKGQGRVTLTKTLTVITPRDGAMELLQELFLMFGTPSGEIKSSLKLGEVYGYH